MSTRLRRAESVFSLLFFLVFSEPVASIQLLISSGGDWTVAVPAVPSPVAAAGNDLSVSVYTSPSNQTILSIAAPFTMTGWIVYVRRDDTSWNPDVEVWIQRTSTGTPGGSLSGGSIYQMITDIDTELFRCGSQTAVSDIQCQLEIRGVSVSNVLTPINLTDILYTVVEY